MAARSNESFEYPGDEVVYRALGETLKALRVERGMSLEQVEGALREALASADPKATHRALGSTIKEAREDRKISRQELSREVGLSLKELISLERAHLERVPAAYFFRISYALKIKPAILARRFEAIQENIAHGRQTKEVACPRTLSKSRE
jgi:transcriptional regulator with XRE-family HTH domain